MVRLTIRPTIFGGTRLLDWLKLTLPRRLIRQHRVGFLASGHHL
jgi:hypothetical protein